MTPSKMRSVVEKIAAFLPLLLIAVCLQSHEIASESVAESMVADMPESERVELWHKNFEWPFKWQDETEGYMESQLGREKEIMQLTGSNERWENWMQYIQTRMVPKFTKNGFHVVDTPVSVHEKLKKIVAFASKDFEYLPYEDDAEDTYSYDTPRYVHLHGLEYEILDELKSMHEEWAGGIELKGTSAYGVRMYQNSSSLVMHHDKVETHVISSIIHIIHDYDDESIPWPLHIEDHNGKMHEVSLEEGQMVFYESAKCLHGRMKTLKGRYYGSLFLHYQPVDESIWNYTTDKVVLAVPPHWNDGTLEESGSRWAGQAITVDSVAVANSPARTVHGEVVHTNVSPHSDDL